MFSFSIVWWLAIRPINTQKNYKLTPIAIAEWDGTLHVFVTKHQGQG